ncbi:MAG TPA: RNA-binding protein [Chthoniobacterales bacterium]|nr:RNA-binding protein [Chthoniobacterales bacterium]
MNSHSYGKRQRHGRGRSRRRGGRGRFQDQRERAQTPKQKTFWQRIVAFFGGNGGGQRKPATQSRNGQQQHSQPLSQPRESRPQRKPEAIEVTTPRLYVGNLSFDATESDLFELFNGVGHVQNAEVVSYRHNQRSKGFAFVSMQTIEEAKRAVEELHDKEFLGRKLVVSGAKSSEHAHE